MQVIVDGLIYEISSQGGVARLYSEILPRMCDMDHDLSVRLLTSSCLRQLPPTHGQIAHSRLLPIERFLRPARLWGRVPFRARMLAQQVTLNWTRHGIWHSTYYTMPPMPGGGHVVTVYDMIHELFPDLFNKLADDQFRARKRCCVLAADAVLCISESTKKDIQQIYGIDSAIIHTVPLACSPAFSCLDEFASRLPLPTAKPFLLYVGGRSHYKNFPLLLHAYSSWDQRRDVDLVVVGQRWSPQEKTCIADMNVEDRVHLLSRVDDKHLNLLYNGASALVYTSLYEGFGIPLLEAMASGCPIVASRIPSTCEIAGELPVYFEPTARDDLIAALDMVMAEGRNSCRVLRGSRRVQQYSWDETARLTLRIYHGLSGLE